MRRITDKENRMPHFRVPLFRSRSFVHAHDVPGSRIPLRSIPAGRRGTGRARSWMRGRRFAGWVFYAAAAGFVAVLAAVLLIVLLVPGGAKEVSAVLPASQAASAAPGHVLFPALAAASPSASPSAAPASTGKPSPAAASKKPRATPAPSALPKMDTLVASYVVKADSYYSDVGYSSNHYVYTEEEYQIMARIIQAEAGGEPYEGKLAVGNVIVNRTLSGHWGPTIAEQVKGLAYDPQTVPKQASLDAARAVLDDEVWVVPQNAYNFKVGGGGWRSFTLWGQIGHHYFYTYHYGSRCDAKSVPPALFKRVFKYAQYGCIPSERVARIQYMLKGLGYTVSADRYFGRDTTEALSAFQQAHHLKADGIAGPGTVAALIRAFGVEKYCKKYPQP
jgi:hypothetical protein